jgi:ADP-heptose:LPS heptosyltransferase
VKSAADALIRRIHPWLVLLLRLPPGLWRRLLPRASPPPPAAPPGAPRSVLVVRGDEIGDLILGLPLLQAIRKGWPDARVTLAAKPPASRLLAGNPLIDEIVEWHPMRIPGPTLAGQLHAVRFAHRALAGRSFDLAVLPRWDTDWFQTPYIAAASGAARVVGFDRTSRPSPRWERAENALLDERIPGGGPIVHELARAEAVAARLGLTPGPRGEVGEALLTPAHREAAEALVAPLRAPGRRLIGVALGANLARRRWPVERFAETIRRVAAGTEVAVIVLGGPQDRALAATLTASLAPGIACLDTTGTLDIPGSIAVFRLVDLYLGGDTGPLHMAGCVGTPAVVVSCHPRTAPAGGIHCPVRFGPWDDSSIVLQPAQPAAAICAHECAGVDAHCILGVTTAQAVAAVRTVLGLPSTADPQRATRTHP